MDSRISRLFIFYLNQLSAFIKNYFVKRVWKIIRLVFKVQYAGNQSSRLSENKPAATAAPAKAGDAAPAAGDAVPAAADPAAAAALEKRVTEQGNRVRDLKAAKADKQDITSAVAELLSLKKQLCVAQGIDPSTLDKKGKKK